MGNQQNFNLLEFIKKGMKEGKNGNPNMLCMQLAYGVTCFFFMVIFANTGKKVKKHYNVVNLQPCSYLTSLSRCIFH